MKQEKLYRLFLFITLLFFYGSVHTLANTLTLEQGSVKIRRQGKDNIYRAIGQVTPLRHNDLIQTSQKSRVRIILRDKKDEIVLQSRSFFKVNLKPQSTAPQIAMPIGKARFKITRRRNPRRRFRIKTANAIIGVKGTDFIIATGEGTTNLLTISGIVSIANVRTPEIAVDVNESQATRIQKTLRPTTPVVLPPQIQEQIIETDSSSSAFANVTFGELIPKPEEKPQKKEEEKKKKEEENSPQKEKQQTDNNQQTATGDNTTGEKDDPLSAETTGNEESTVTDPLLFPEPEDDPFPEPELIVEPDIEIPEIEIPEIEVDIDTDKTVEIKINH